MNERVARLISEGEQEVAIQTALEQQGFESIETNALTLVTGGVTTRGEIARVIRLDPAVSL